MEVDVAVVGAGIVGLAVARELNRRHPGLELTVVERERQVGSRQTARNSGVVHAGIYYAPGSLKARLCVEGARALYAFCDEHGVPYERCGKVIVARDGGELARLGELERRGRENGVPGLERLSAGELRELEPHCRGVAALRSPETGVVDFAAVARALEAELGGRGVAVQTGRPVVSVAQRAGRIVLGHPGDETAARFAVFCAGGESDRLAVMAGASPDPRVVPFRGSYLKLRPERAELVRALIYPVPDPRLPFLGVHLSRHIDGSVTLGPSALLVAAARHVHLARHLADGPALVAHRRERAGARGQPAAVRPRGGRLRAGAPRPRPRAGLPRRARPGEWLATAASSTTSSCRAASARSTCGTRRHRPRRRRWRWRA